MARHGPAIAFVDCGSVLLTGDGPRRRGVLHRRPRGSRHPYPGQGWVQQGMNGDDHVAVTYGPAFAAAPDATGGALALDVTEFRVAHAPVIDLVDPPDILADALELPWRGAFRHGFCWGLLVPDGTRVLVVVMGHAGPDLEGPGAVVGRLPDQAASRFLDLWGGRAARVSLLIEATPGLLSVEVRYRTLAVGAPPVPGAVGTENPEQASPATASFRPAVLAPVVLARAETPAPDMTPTIATIDVAVEVEALREVAAEPVPAPGSEPTAEPEPPPVVVEPVALTPPDPPAGWYVDPFDAAGWRWWDGIRWSVDAAPRSPESDPTD